MTNSDISGFLSSISEAKRAFDQEPFYLKQISELERDKQRLGETVAARELRIHELKQIEDHLNAKLRSVEAERDDAGFRLLEADDKVQNLLSVVHGVINDALKAVSAVEGYEQIVVNKADRQRELDYANSLQDRAVELENELQSLRDDMRLAQEQLTRPFATPPATSSSQGEDTDPFSEVLNKDYKWQDQPHSVSSAIGQGQSEAPPTASVSDPTPPALGNESVTDPTLLSPSVNMTSTVVSQNAPTQSASPADSALGTTSAEGQSDGPFASQAQSQPESQTVGSDTVTSVESAVSSASQTPPERNRDRSTFFTNRKYYDVTYFVPIHQWLAEGGTEADYNWRPPVLFPQANRASHNS